MRGVGIAGNRPIPNENVTVNANEGSEAADQAMKRAGIEPDSPT